MKRKLNSILLIDDDEDSNYFNKRIIGSHNITEHIQIAETGKEAIDYLTNKGRFAINANGYPAPALIFLDINMPVMDGWEFLEHYFRLPDEQKGKIIVIMLTSSPNPEDVKKSEEIDEVSDFLKKPLTKDLLNEILQKHFPE